MSWVFSKIRGTSFRGPHNGDYSILLIGETAKSTLAPTDMEPPKPQTVSPLFQAVVFVGPLYSLMFSCFGFRAQVLPVCPAQMTTTGPESCGPGKVFASQGFIG